MGIKTPVLTISIPTCCPSSLLILLLKVMPNDLPVDFKTRIIAQFTFYLTEKDKKGKIKEKKIAKVKKLDFPLASDNYVDFLETLLEKHSQDKYKVMERHSYSFKYLYPS
jgi:hypothetical protein